MLIKIVILVIGILASQLTISHGGRLNEQGCHNDKIAAGSHCHRASLGDSGAVNSEVYSRDAFNYDSYKPNLSVGFYTGVICSKINIDHVVSLKDAFESGASSWGAELKKIFANDRENHVPSCSRVNSSKGSGTPKDFLRRSSDGQGFDFKITDFCKYAAKYYFVKLKYSLSFAVNNERIFADCGMKI